MNNAIDKKNYDKEDQSLIDKVDSRIEQHMKNLGYKSSKKSLQFKQLRNQFIELWYLRHELKQELLENKDDTGIDEMFFQKCNEKFNLDLPVQLKNISQVPPTRQESVQTHIEQSPF